MNTIDEIRTDCHTLMFDLYGTLVDMQRGLTAAITPYLKEKGWKGRPDALVTWWRRTHFENSMIDALLHRDQVDELKAEVRRRWPPGTRLDVSALKELTGLSRKYVIPLLEFLDREKVTRRSGADRMVL